MVAPGIPTDFIGELRQGTLTEYDYERAVGDTARGKHHRSWGIPFLFPATGRFYGFSMMQGFWFLDSPLPVQWRPSIGGALACGVLLHCFTHSAAADEKDFGFALNPSGEFTFQSARDKLYIIQSTQTFDFWFDHVGPVVGTDETVSLENTNSDDGSWFFRLEEYAPLEGLVAYYPFHGSALDRSGLGNHGVPIGAERIPDRAERPADAFEFNGIADRIDCGNGPSLNGLNALTVAFWFRTPVFRDGKRVVSKWGLDSGFDFVIVESTLWFALNQRVQNRASLAGLENLWTHVAATLDGTTARLYINGVESSSQVFSETLEDSPNNLLIGAMSNLAPVGFFNGAIDEVRIYNRGLAQSDIVALATE